MYNKEKEVVISSLRLGNMNDENVWFDDDSIYEKEEEYMDWVFEQTKR